MEVELWAGHFSRAWPEVQCGHVEFVMSIGHPSGNVE